MEIEFQQTITRNGRAIPEIDGRPASYRRTTVKKYEDDLEKVVGNGQARVSVSLNETVGGPEAYSSVRLGVHVTLTCNQDADTIKVAHDLAFQECVGALDSTIDDAMKMLVTHIERVAR